MIGNFENRRQQAPALIDREHQGLVGAPRRAASPSVQDLSAASGW